MNSHFVIDYISNYYFVYSGRQPGSAVPERPQNDYHEVDERGQPAADPKPNPDADVNPNPDVGEAVERV